MPYALQMASFIHFYGPSYYQHDRWPTKDKVIPWKTFVVMSRAMRSAMALQRISMTQAVTHGIVQALDGNTPHAEKIAREEIKELYGED